MNVSYEWVRGHSGHPLNELADRLAVLARRNREIGVDETTNARMIATVRQDAKDLQIGTWFARQRAWYHGAVILELRRPDGTILQTASLPDRTPGTLRSPRGAFDLPSILIAVVVVGILTAGVLTAVFGVIPRTHDERSKQNLSAVRTAEGPPSPRTAASLTRPGCQRPNTFRGPLRLTVSTDPARTC